MVSAFPLILSTVLCFSIAYGAFNLPAGADELLAEPLNMDFSCKDRPYGYYADTNNNCQLFHICMPIEDAQGNVIDFNQWTFLCSNGTLFDQQTLSCNYASDAFPCDQADSLYGAVEFGLKEE